MNNILAQIEKWFGELGIYCVARPTCLMVSRDGITNLGTNEEILAEIKSTINKRVFISHQDDNWVHFDCI